MLLLFWKLEGISVGQISRIKWYHGIDYPPRYFCSGENGLTIINPYLKHPDLVPECSFTLTPAPCTTSCWFDDEIIIGTQNQAYRVPWAAIKDSECLITAPANVTTVTSPSYSTASGLPSDSILQMDAWSNYLSILTSAGLYWENRGTGTTLTCLTNSGSDVFISPGPTLYLAQGTQVNIKRGEPVDLVRWDEVFYVDHLINQIWVTTHDDQDTLFIATTSGLVIKQGDQSETYLNVISGSKNIECICVEYDTTLKWGHVFTGSETGVNVINTSSGISETYLQFNGLPVMALGYERFYSK
jgi:hypothetical protein